MNKVVFITGASSGIGKATAEKLLNENCIVYGGARNLEKLKSIVNLKPIEIDMAEYGSLEKAVSKIVKAEGRIDVLFNNAGYGLYGTVEDVPIEEAKAQFDVNLFGLARLTQLVLPHMRKQKSGTIINTSSIGGKIYTPLGAWYHATKHALEGWSDSLRIELKQFDIEVVIIEPGAIQTDWGKTASDNLLKFSGKGAYKNFAKSAAKNTLGRYQKGNLSSPDVIANAVSKAIESDNPKPRYVAGKYARSILFARKYLGDRIFDKLISISLK